MNAEVATSGLIRITHYTGPKDNLPKPAEVEWQHLADWLTTHQPRERKAGPLWSPARLEDGKTRAKENVVELSLLTLDLDDGVLPTELEPGWERWEYVIHSTFSSTTDHPKWRAVFPLSRPVPNADWPRVYRRLVAALAAGHSDPACKDSSRMYYVPSYPPGSEPFASRHEGEWLDPDAFPDPPEEPKRRADWQTGRNGKAPPGEGDYSTLDVVAWFSSHGCYGRPLGGGKHTVGCPFGHEHTDPDEAGDSDTVVWEAGGPGSRLWPQFHCSHGHCDGRGIGSVMQLWGNADRFCSRTYGSSAAADPHPPPGDEHSPPGDAKQKPLTDLGNAERFEELNAEDVRYSGAGGWATWSGSLWRTSEIELLDYRASHVVRCIYREASEIV